MHMLMVCVVMTDDGKRAVNKSHLREIRSGYVCELRIIYPLRFEAY